MNKGLKLLIFLKKGELKREIWEKLDNPKTATEIAKELGKHRSAISRILLDMEEKGFARCVNPEDKNFRHYIKIKTS